MLLFHDGASPCSSLLCYPGLVERSDAPSNTELSGGARTSHHLTRRARHLLATSTKAFFSFFLFLLFLDRRSYGTDTKKVKKRTSWPVPYRKSTMSHCTSVLKSEFCSADTTNTVSFFLLFIQLEIVTTTMIITCLDSSLTKLRIVAI